jgi:hypothetical protein
MLCFMVLIAPAAAQRLYRWVDDQGNVHYTDSMPPSQAGKAHSEMSEQGMRLREVPPAKTLEEVERERELERLREQQERLIEAQKAADDVLLRAYRSVDDLIMARDGRLAGMDVRLEIDDQIIRKKQKQLEDLRAQAAENKRDGRPVDRKLAAAIADAERSIEEQQSLMLQREQQKREIREHYDRDLNRYRQLRNLSATQRDEAALDAGMSLGNIIECDRVDECERIWQRATDYLKRHATVPIETAGENLVMTIAPDSEADIALTLSRLWKSNGQRATIFLDTRCQRNQAAGTACQTAARIEVLNGFRSAVEGRQPTADLDASNDR